MSEEREIEQFSLNLYYIMEENKTTILDHQHNELGSFIQKFNQEEKNFHIFDYNFSNASVYQLQELPFFQLHVPIICHAEKIKIDGFPLKREIVNPIISIYKRDYVITNIS